MECITQLSEQVGVSRACKSLDLARSTYYARLRPRPPIPAKPRPRPVRMLSQEEHDEAVALLTSELYVDKAPASIVASLLDLGIYICSVRTFYRILMIILASGERRNMISHPVYSKPELMATKPCEVWTWDITKLKGPRKGILYSLYVILDMFSRFITGWTLAHCEDQEIARELIDTACARQGIGRKQLTIHADNGGVMRSNTLSELFDKLSITRSHSRPHCSNDNPYSESHFKTMKYSPAYPERFGGFDDAHVFCQQFVEEYNYNMFHSGIAMLTPAMVHHGQAAQVIEQRQLVMANAYQRHPERFVKGLPQHQLLPNSVWINKPENDSHMVVNS